MKYYLDRSKEEIFYILGKNRKVQVKKNNDQQLYNAYLQQIETNTSALNYYQEAYKFSKWVQENLYNLSVSNNVSGVKDTGNGKIFKNENIEYSSSNFNLHRKEVIRKSIESNLSAAIANFNGYTNSGTNFQMPKLNETEWEMLQNDVSIISFLQGLNLGTKLYNGYTVVTNSKTEEVVKEERIYITTNDGYYHSINDRHFVEDNFDIKTIQAGVLDLDFEIRKDLATGTSYMQKQGLGCYTSIVEQKNTDNTYDSIYEYLNKNKEKIEDKIEQKYYIALGRERWGTYKIGNSSNILTIIEEMEENTKDDSAYVMAGLIRHYDGTNNTGNGHSNNITQWKDLTGNCDGIIHGARIGSNYVSVNGANGEWVNLGQIKGLEAVTLDATVSLNAKQEASGYILTNFDWGGIGLQITKDRVYTRVYIEESELRTTYAAQIEKQLEIGKIYNIIGTYDGQKIKLYIDGIMVAEQELVGTFREPQNNTVMAIGVNPTGTTNGDGEYSNISVYSVRIYDRALTYNQVKQNYESVKDIKNTITAKTLEKDDYGGYVTNYVAPNGVNDEGINWRIFHSDGTNIYLIADDYVSKDYVPNGKMNSKIYKNASNKYCLSFDYVYKDYNGWSNILRTSPAKWLRQYEGAGYNSTNINMKSTAYMLDTSVWNSKYANNYAEYAIGGPTLELFAESYNVTHGKKINTKVASQLGYQVKWSTNTNYTNSISGLDSLGNLYVISSTAKTDHMWLASPANSYNDYLMSISYGGSVTTRDYYYGTRDGFRPIICLKSNVEFEKQDDGTYLIVN